MYQPHDIKHIVETSLDLTRPSIDTQDITVKQGVPGDLPMVSIDGQQISQVLVNLIINAAQAVDHQGVVTIRVGEADQHLEIQVSDNGCGIPEDIQKTIFEPFISTKSESGGIGLGLYICKEIIEAHGGTILVDSKEGEGTTFTISLPISATHGVPDGRNGQTPEADINSF